MNTSKIKQWLINTTAMILVFVTASLTLLIMTEIKKKSLWQSSDISLMDDNEDEFVTLTYYYVCSSVPNDLARVNSELNKALKEKLNCSVKLKPIIESEYESTVGLMINSADEFDICFTSNWLLDYYEYARKGAFLNISQVLDQYAPTVKQVVSQKLIDAATINGELYGVVNNQIIPRTPGLSFNKEWYEKFMADNPDYEFTSLEDEEAYFEYCLDHNADQTNMSEGFYPEGLLCIWGFDDMGGFSSPGVVRVDDETVTVINQFDSKEFKDMIELSRKYYSKGYMGDISRALVQSKELVYVPATWKPGGSEEESLARGAEIVNISIGESYFFNSWLLSSMNAISATSKHPIRALKFLELLYSDKELFNLLTFGVENVHFTKTGSNSIQSVVNSKYNITGGWVFGNQFNAYLLNGQDENTWKVSEDLNKNAKDSVLVGFQFDPSNVQTEILNCYSVYNEYIVTFIYGAYLERTQEKYTEFINKMNAAGAQTIIQEKQRQINEWMSKK